MKEEEHEGIFLYLLKGLSVIRSRGKDPFNLHSIAYL